MCNYTFRLYEINEWVLEKRIKAGHQAKLPEVGSEGDHLQSGPVVQGYLRHVQVPLHAAVFLTPGSVEVPQYTVLTK